MSRSRAVRLAVTLLVVLGGCKKGAPPTAPTPTPTTPAPVAPAAPAGLMVGALSMRNRTVALRWNGSTGATAYVVELGSSSGAADLATVTTPDARSETTLNNVRAGTGTLFARVRARNDVGASGPSSETSFVLPDLQDYVDAIFLGSGPLRADPPQCPRSQSENPAVWAGFSRGTTISSPMSTAISSSNQALLRTTVDLIPDATLNAIRVTVEETEERAIIARANESPFAVSEALMRDCSTQGCCAPPGTIACAGAEFVNGRSGVMRFSKSIFLDGTTGGSAAHVHEIGHAILGMCHISAEAIGGRVEPSSLMAASPQGTINLPSRLTPFDIEAAQAIFGSPLNPGASRAALVGVGVVKP